MATALIPGTYDPVTNGHLDIIERSTQIFDKIVVGVAASPSKNGRGPLFNLEERVAFIEQATKHLNTVRVESFSKLLVDFAVEVGAQAIVKGLRVVTDFESEFQQASINYQLNPELETVFIMSNPANMYLSSSMVKEVAALQGSIAAWVPPEVEAALRSRFANG
ncbi:MAG: pantetheine-phosphate adenylyltransferase [Coriobacteriia bacterium]|jgi:pantetheine-phosphate adenylyltransferase|nr:pantetheine-phosphate adenylyltransferase [Coriobacteriia bacterium]MDR2714220.1 pantetheine-phosphate adenylyltransferase [Coriobacteriales bacterium]